MVINLFHTTKFVYVKICYHRSCPWRLAEQLEFAPYGSFHTSFVGIPRSMCCHHVTRTGCRQMQSPWLWFQVVFSAFNYVWMLCCCWECKCFRHDSSWQHKQFEKSFHARFQPRIQRYGQIYSRMHVMHSLDPIWHPQKKKRSHSPTMILHDGIVLSVFFLNGMESPCPSLTEERELFFSWICFGNSAPSHAFFLCCPKLYLQTWTPKSGL